MLGLWDYNHFPMIYNEATWERTMADERSLRHQVAGGYFVPIRVLGDGPWDMEVRVGTAAAPARLTEREHRLVKAASRDYLYRASSFVCFGGMEKVESWPPTEVGVIDVDSGEYVANIHWLDWELEPDVVGPRGQRSPDALPDFVVLLNPYGGGEMDWDLGIDTFRWERSDDSEAV